jgi:hypothetical protein
MTMASEIKEKGLQFVAASRSQTRNFDLAATELFTLAARIGSSAPTFLELKQRFDCLKANTDKLEAEILASGHLASGAPIQDNPNQVMAVEHLLDRAPEIIKRLNDEVVKLLEDIRSAG